MREVHNINLVRENDGQGAVWHLEVDGQRVYGSSVFDAEDKQPAQVFSEALHGAMRRQDRMLKYGPGA